MVNIIYTTKVDWEPDWLEDVIFKDVQCRIHFDPTFNTVLPNAVLVMNEVNGRKIDAYIEKFVKKKYKFGVIHLSDEAYQHPTQYYRQAEFVLRNYYSKAYENLGNVFFFPLGYKKGFKVNPGYKEAGSRTHVWNFIGQLMGKPTRESMVNSLAEIEGGFLYATRCWDDPKGLSVEEYQEVLEDSVFTACPSGWINPDSFRLCEALETGSIPIVERKEYFEALFKGPVPFVVSNGWQNVTQEFLDKIDVNKVQDECFLWWTEQKKKFNEQFKKLAKKVQDS